jgi:hypothetical protein
MEVLWGQVEAVKKFLDWVARLLHNEPYHQPARNDQMKIEGFEKPKRTSSGGRKGSDIYGLRSMAVGESTFHGSRNGEPAQRVRVRMSNTIAYVQKSKGMKFSTSTVLGNTTYGNWTAPSDGVVVTRMA